MPGSGATWSFLDRAKGMIASVSRCVSGRAFNATSASPVRSTLRFLFHISRRDRHRKVATSSIGFGKTSVIRNRSHGRSGRRHSVGPPPARRCIPPRAVKYPEESFPDNVAEPIWEKASGTALYRGSARLFRPRPGRLEQTCINQLGSAVRGRPLSLCQKRD